MKKSKNSKFIISENEQSIEVVIPPPRFNNSMTLVFIVMDIILIFPIIAIICGIYYADFPYKIGLALFSIPWVFVGVFINSFWNDLFVNATHIDIDSEKINIYQTSRKKENELLLQSKEIDYLKVCKYHVDTSHIEPIIIKPDIILSSNNCEHSISSFTDTNFSDEEIILLANELNKYLRKDIKEKNKMRIDYA